MADRHEPPIDHSVWIKAEPPDVFDYFTDPKKLVQWMGDQAELDAAPDGVYRVVFKEGWVSRGRFVVVDRPNRLVYTVGWEGHPQFPPGSTRVELTFAPERGGTRLRLKHFGPPSTGLESEGWASYLKRLAAVAAGDVAPGDPFDRLARGELPE